MHFFLYLSPLFDDGLGNMKQTRVIALVLTSPIIGAGEAYMSSGPLIISCQTRAFSRGPCSGTVHAGHAWFLGGGERV